MQIRSGRQVCHRGLHSRGGVLCQRHSAKLHTDVDTTHNSCSKGKNTKFICKQICVHSPGSQFHCGRGNMDFYFHQAKESFAKFMAGDSG